jgi:hypothetical protein
MEQRPGLRDLRFFTCGTAHFGDPALMLGARLDLARRALGSGAWLHIATGAAINLIDSATLGQTPRETSTMFRIAWAAPQQFVHQQISAVLRPMRLQQMRICQLCMGGLVADGLVAGGDTVEAIRRLKLRGIVQRFTLEITRENDSQILAAVRAGVCDGLIDGFALTCGPLEIGASNALWDALIARDVPIIALNPTGGVSTLEQIDAIPESMPRQAAELLPMLRETNESDWTKFCLRFARAIPQVRSIVVSPRSAQELDALIEFTTEAAPLAASAMAEILAFARRCNAAT